MKRQAGRGRSRIPKYSVFSKSNSPDGILFSPNDFTNDFKLKINEYVKYSSIGEIIKHYHEPNYFKEKYPTGQDAKTKMSKFKVSTRKAGRKQALNKTRRNKI